MAVVRKLSDGQWMMTYEPGGPARFIVGYRRLPTTVGIGATREMSAPHQQFLGGRGIYPQRRLLHQVAGPETLAAASIVQLSIALTLAIARRHRSGECPSSTTESDFTVTKQKRNIEGV
jgi:hypothetical protein